LKNYLSLLCSSVATLAFASQSFAGLSDGRTDRAAIGISGPLQSGPVQNDTTAAVRLAQAAPAPIDKKLAQARLRGAVDADINAFIAARDPQVRPYYRELFVEGERNAVLNFDRLGLIELQRHHLADAAWLFDRAAERIDAIYANDANAQKAKSLWSEESVKDFKGEPYERAMTFYYRGLVRLMMNDYDNAQANFRRAEEQTLVSESENYKNSSFAALTYLAGWATNCAGNTDSAAEFYRKSALVNSGLKAPDPGDNLLLIAEVGSGPSKTGQGEYHEALKMVAGSGPARSSFALPKEPPPPAPVLLDVSSPPTWQPDRRRRRLGRLPCPPSRQATFPNSR